MTRITGDLPEFRTEDGTGSFPTSVVGTSLFDVVTLQAKTTDTCYAAWHWSSEYVQWAYMIRQARSDLAFPASSQGTSACLEPLLSTKAPLSDVVCMAFTIA